MCFSELRGVDRSPPGALPRNLGSETKFLTKVFIRIMKTFDKKEGVWGGPASRYFSMKL